MPWESLPRCAANENDSYEVEVGVETLKICNEKQQVRYNLKYEYAKFKRETKNFN